MKLPSLPEYVYPGVFTLYTGHGRDKLYRLIKDGNIRAKKTDTGRMLIEVKSIKEYIDSLPNAGNHKAPHHPTVDLFE
jgi:hypothetical protein